MHHSRITCTLHVQLDASLDRVYNGFWIPESEYESESESEYKFS